MASFSTLLLLIGMLGANQGPQPFKTEFKGKTHSYEYSWPKEAAALPKLRRQLNEDMEASRAGIRDEADTAYRESQADGSWFPEVGYQAIINWELAGQSSRLLSLSAMNYVFTGGAHGLTNSGSLLWDRELDKGVSWQSLLRPGTSWSGAIRQPFCVLLNREREKRREEPVKPDDLFGNCPELKELTVLLSDSDKNGRFDHVMVIADQYVAGPYAEGP